MLKSCLPVDVTLVTTLAFSFGNATALDREFVRKHDNAIGLITAARILQAALLVAVHADTIIAAMREFKIDTIDSALAIVRLAVTEARGLSPSTPVVCGLVIDEVQQLADVDVELLRSFTRLMGQVQLRHSRRNGLFFCPILLATVYGTIQQVARKSMFALCLLPLPLFSLDESKELLARVFDFLPTPTLSWSAYAELERCLLLCGGWPRVLQRFVQELQRKRPVQLQVAADVRAALNTTYGALSSSRFTAWAAEDVKRTRFLLAAAVLRAQFLAKHMVPPSSTETLLDVAGTGACVLQQEGSDEGADKASPCVVIVPHVVLHHWANSLIAASHELYDLGVYRHLRDITQAGHWQAFEELVWKHVGTRLALYGPLGLGVAGFSLSDLLVAAEGDMASLAVQFASSPECIAVRSLHRWPSAHALDAAHCDSRHIILLAAGSPGIDIVAPLQRTSGELFYLCFQVRHTCAADSSTPLELAEVEKAEQDLKLAIASMRGEGAGESLPPDFLLVVVTNRSLGALRREMRALPPRVVFLDVRTLLGPVLAELVVGSQQPPPAPTESPERRAPSARVTKGSVRSSSLEDLAPSSKRPKGKKEKK